MAEFDLADFMSPEGAEAFHELYNEIVRRMDAASVDYKFLAQMIGGDNPLPNDQALTVIMATRYARAMKEWDGKDPLLPMMFAYLTVREVFRND